MTNRLFLWYLLTFLANGFVLGIAARILYQEKVLECVCAQEAKL